jgi:glycosyltransferase involved in cell wall biosynthesis
VVVAARVQEHGERIKAEGFRLAPLKLRRRSANLWQEIAALLEIIWIYRHERPDLVHHVALKPVLYGSLAARLARVRGVVNALTGLGYVFIAPGLKGRLLRSLFSVLFHLAFSGPNTRVIFQNSEDLDLFVTRGLISRERSVLIRGSGVNTETFRPGPPQAGDRAPRIVMASRMLWDKGVDELVGAVRLLMHRKIPGRVLLAGRLDPENPAAIPEETLKTWQHEGLIEWLGFREDMAELLRSCDIAVLPSYREGVPKSLLEAAAVGLPLIAANVPGCREIVKDGVNGFLVPPKDPAALAGAMARLLRDAGLCQRMGRASREMAIRDFAEGIIIKQTLLLYEGLMSNERQEKSLIKRR